jgi:hypothetical protein
MGCLGIYSECGVVGALKNVAIATINEKSN